MPQPRPSSCYAWLQTKLLWLQRVSYKETNAAVSEQDGRLR